jgi:ATP-binding cassette subfamily B protein
LLKRRLLVGALGLDLDETRHQGAGQLLGRVLESAAVETLALAGGLLAVSAVLGLGAAAVVLVLGAGAGLLVPLLLLWLGFALGLGWRYYRRRRRWTEERLAMTDALVERMVGHRTRLAQEPHDRWHEGEDEALAHYLAGSRGLDRGLARLLVLLPRGWLLLSLLGLLPAFLAGESGSAGLAVALGGVVLAFRAFRDLAEGIDKLATAVIAWQRVRLLWRAASRPEPLGVPVALAALGGSGATGAPVLELRGVSYRYRADASAVMHGLDLEVRSGERLLLRGPSGGGKSTLAAVAAGLRSPSAGLVLLRGLDYGTVGRAAWRRRIVLAPQFHDNHIVLGTLAFNLLLARGWPPRTEDLAEAERVCRALGLGPLLERMPSGLGQMVGETGWQLSHGERSRVYLARALLQGADLLILDESFAALDPPTLQQALHFVLREPPALLVIAHP